MAESLTVQERAVVDLLAAAWNAFLSLPEQHNDDVHEFRRIIHAGQEKVLARPAVRALNGG
ncbi:hypothetical protein [Sphingomonas azotifigens]|uniref:hypothetical protein n=1 Tax=Sphingomonas azotifigens TaxID=330920 RepID=UPI0009FD7D06|nr:hypothetical protein [Sphingomonas azotifigens]